MAEASDSFKLAEKEGPEQVPLVDFVSEGIGRAASQASLLWGRSDNVTLQSPSWLDIPPINSILKSAEQPVSAEKKLDAKAAPADVISDARDAFLKAAKTAGLDDKTVADLCKQLESNIAKDKAEGRQVPSVEQVAKTYKSLAELVSGKPTKDGLSQELRNELCVDTLKNLSNAKGIFQAQNTCNVTVIEKYAAMREPDKYARLVTEIGLTGQYTTEDGKVVKPPPQAIRPEEGPVDRRFPEMPLPNLASRVYQNTALNLHPYYKGQFAGGTDRESQRDVGGLFDEARIQEFAKSLVGKKLPYIGLDPPTSVEQIEQWKKSGDFPIVLETQGHVQTVHDVRRKNDGQLELEIDNNHDDADKSLSLPTGWHDMEKVRKEQYVFGAVLQEDSNLFVFKNGSKTVEVIDKKTLDRCVYDKKGKPVEILSPDGSWKRSIDGGKEWLCYDAKTKALTKHAGTLNTEGKRFPSLELKEALPVDERDKEVAARRNEVGKKYFRQTISEPDGTTTDVDDSGSVNRDKDGRVQWEKPRIGNKTHFVWKADKPQASYSEGGDYIVSTDGGQTFFKNDGYSLKKLPAPKIVVDKSGTPSFIWTFEQLQAAAKATPAEVEAAEAAIAKLRKP